MTALFRATHFYMLIYYCVSTTLFICILPSNYRLHLKYRRSCDIVFFMQNYTSYHAMKKPTWAPPASVFSPVWTVLYGIIIVSFGYVIASYFTNSIPFSVLLPFLLNVIFNVAFTPIQFGLKNNILALIDILLVLGTLGWALYAIYPYLPDVAWVNIPYFLWVSYATLLQMSITYLNR